MFCMTLRARLAAGILAIAIVLVTPLTLALRSLDQLHASVIQLRNNEFAASLLLGRLRGATGDLSRAEDNLLILHDSASLGRMTAQISALKAMTDSLAGYALDTAATNIRAGLDEVARTAPLEYHAAAAGHAQSARADTISINHARPAISRMEGWISAAEGSLNERTSARAEIAATRAERARHFAAGVLVFAAGLATVIAVWLTRSVSRPVRDVEAGMAAVAGGEFSHRLTVAANRHDEFGRLAASFASMTKQLAELDKLKAEFVSVASHELKTPVNVMLGYLQLLQEGVETQVERRLRQREDEPVLRDDLHPRADARGAGAKPLHAEVAIGEGGKHPAEGPRPQQGRRGDHRVGGGTGLNWSGFGQDVVVVIGARSL